jgi:hypothetical protein
VGKRAGQVLTNTGRARGDKRILRIARKKDTLTPHTFKEERMANPITKAEKLIRLMYHLNLDRMHVEEIAIDLLYAQETAHNVNSQTIPNKTGGEHRLDPAYDGIGLIPEHLRGRK